MIEQLMNAIADSDLECSRWGDTKLRELAIVVIECWRDIARQQIVDEDGLQAVLNDAKVTLP